jgi:two-component system cell cycle sensor histidine kinase/response regulator CckA
MLTAKIRILLVDDDEDDRLLIRDMVQEAADARLELHAAGDFESAVAQIKSAPFQLFLFDYRLGEKTGLDLLKLSLAQSPHTPVILLTGYNDRDVDWQAIREGADDYLVKNELNAAILARAVRYALARAENKKRIKEREESFQSLINSVLEGILVLGDDGVILDCNDVLAELLKTSTQQLIGLPSGESLPKELVEAIRSLKGKDSVELQRMETSFADQKPPKRLEVTLKPYVYKGQSASLMALMDITARKAMEAQLLQQDRLASLGLLASSLAHEIGTPLGVIRGRAELLGLQVENNPEIKRSVEAIVSQIDRVAKLIRSLLNLARGAPLGSRQTLQLTNVVKDVTDLISAECRHARVDLKVDVPEGLYVQITTEGESLQQVLLNLVVNSLHAIQSKREKSREGSANREDSVLLSVQPTDESIVISITDSGCGISQENLKNIFQPFFTTKAIGVGTGLGLATSFRIVSSWGGRMDVESSEGNGATFRIILPRFRSVE